MILAFFVTAVAVSVVVLLRLVRNNWKRHCTHSKTASCIGFVHPNAYGGGGGERVLWVAIEQLMEQDIRNDVERRYILYTGPLPDDANPLVAAAEATTEAGGNDGAKKKKKRQYETTCFKHAIVQLAEKQFGGRFRRRVEVVELSEWTVKLQNPKYYPRLTLILQSLVGGVILGLDVLLRCGSCDVLIDSVGIAFAYPLYKYLGGCQVAAYVHYPTVSSDMIQRVQDRKQEGMYNNSAAVAKSPLLTKLKIQYYRAFAKVYRMVGTCADVIMTNSSWTNGHIQNIWGGRLDGDGNNNNPSTFKSTIVFPPVNVATFTKFPLEPRGNHIVSIGQFRPEKNHMLQIESYARAIEKGGIKPDEDKCHLYLVGGARNEEDRARVAELKKEIVRRNLEDKVFLEVSVPFDRIKELLGSSAIGLHSMLDEHFGIVVVEYLAAGCVALANNSGGVKADIVDKPLENGVLASTAEEYADAMISLLNLRKKGNIKSAGGGAASLLPATWREMQDAGRKKAAQFRDEGFGQAFTAALEPVMNLKVPLTE